MKKIFCMIFSVMFLFASIAHAEIETYTGKGEATMGESETLEKVIERAKQYAKREAIEKAGVYIRSRSEVRNLELVEDKIISLAGGIVKVVDSDKEIISKDNSVKVFVTVTITIDTDDLQREIDKYFEKNTQKTKIEVVQEKIEKKSSEVDNIALSKQKTDEAFILCEVKKFDDALKVANEAISLNPNNAESYHARGWANMALKNYEQAIADYNKNIELNPKNKFAYQDLGFIYSGFWFNNEKFKNYDKALFYFNKAIELDENFSHFYRWRGLLYHFSGNFYKAIENYSKAIELDPNTDAYHDRGNAYRDLKQYDKAILDYKKDLKIHPNCSWVYHGRGVYYFVLKNYNQAIKDLNKAIELNPNNSETYYYRGLCYQALGENKKAEADFAKARQLGWNG